MEYQCGKRVRSISAPINDVNGRRLLREGTAVNKADSIPLFGPKDSEESCDSSNSASGLISPEATGCVMIPESKRILNSNDIQKTSETKMTGNLDVISTRCDKPVGQIILTESPEDVPMTSSETISHEANEIKDSMPKEHTKRKENDNKLIERHSVKRPKATAVGGSEVPIRYCNPTQTSSGIRIFNSFSTGTRCFFYARDVSINSCSTCDIYMVSCENICITSDSTGKILMESCEHVYIDTDSTGGIFIETSENVNINSDSTGEICIDTSKDICIDSDSTGGIRIKSCENVHIDSDSTDEIFIDSSKNVCINADSTGRISYTRSCENISINSI